MNMKVQGTVFPLCDPKVLERPLSHGIQNFVIVLMRLSYAIGPRMYLSNS